MIHTNTLNVLFIVTLIRYIYYSFILEYLDTLLYKRIFVFTAYLEGVI